MTIQWQSAPTNYGTFNDTLFEFFKLLEANDLQKRLNLHNVLGNLTIGIGFDLRAGGEDVQKRVFEVLGLDYYYPDNHANVQPGTPEWIESDYITRLKAAVLGSDPSAVNTIMAQRAADTRLDGIKPNRRSSFSFNNDTEVKNVFISLWADVYSKKIFDALPALKNNADFNKSNELLALGSFAWNSGSISKDLRDAINAGNRAEAWYWLRYDRYLSWNSTTKKYEELPGLVKRRFFESEVFGLYNDPEGSGVGVEEAKEVYRMFTKHRADIAKKEAKYGVAFDGTPGTVLINGKSVQQAANDDFQSIRTVFIEDKTVDTLEENLDLAKYALLADLRIHHPEIADKLTDSIVSTNIYLNPAKPTDADQRSLLDTRDYETETTGADDLMIGMGQRDMMYGGKGNDILLGEGGNDQIEGGKGNDTLVGGAGDDDYYFSSGDGSDKIIDNEGENAIIWVDANNKARVMKTFYKSGDAEWKSPDGTVEINKHSPYKIVLPDGSIIELGEDISSLGINLRDVPVNPQTNNTIEGDLKPIDYDPVTSGDQTKKDSLGNIIVDPEKSAPNRNDYLYDSTGNDRIEGGGGDDWIDAQRGGDDWLLGGDGRDAIASQNFTGAPSDKDIIEGGAGGDMLWGGADDDQVFAANYDEMENLIAQGEIAENINEKGDLATGNAGDDLVYGSTRKDALFGGEGHDLLVGGGGDDLIMGDDDFSSSTFNWSYTVTNNQVNFSNLVFTQGTFKGDDAIYAGTGNDMVFGGGGDDEIYGGAGNDTVIGQSGDDFITGDDGNDTLLGDNRSVPVSEQGSDYIDGGNGNDAIYGGAWADDLFGGDGSDVIYGDDVTEGAGDDYIDGEADNDTIFGAAGSDTIFGGEGDDYLQGDIDNDYIDGEAGNDRILGGAGADEIYGGEGNDELHGDTSNIAVSSQGSDIIDGGAGDDVIYGYGGDDQINGGEGNDTLYGGAGDDILDGGDGIDTVDGGTGNDTYVFNRDSGQDTITDTDTTAGNIDTVLLGDDISPSDIKLVRSGNDLKLNVINTYDSLILKNWLIEDSASKIEKIEFSDGTIWDVATIKDILVQGTEGNDALTGFATADTMNGFDGNDIISGLEGDDTLDGGSGDDTILGSQGNDISDGGTGNDYIYDEAGNDSLLGGEGNDTLYSGAGNDVLDGGSGNDVLYGATGNDIYKFDKGSGQDIIWDYDTIAGNIDTILLGTDIQQSDVILQRSGENLALSINGTEDSLTVQDWFKNGSSANQVEHIQFADGTIWDAETIKQMVPPSPNLGLTINGSGILTGGNGDDMIYGSGGTDILDGGTGNDTLDGGSWSDTYKFRRGSGADTIYDFDYYGWGVPSDTIEFGAGITVSDLEFIKDGEHLCIAIKETTDSLTIQYWFVNNGYKIEKFKFADGAVLNISNIEAMGYIEKENNTSSDDTLSGTSSRDILDGGAGNDILDGGGGDDYLQGGDDNDILDGGAGNDYMEGNGGHDIYRFGRGSGQDTINDYKGDEYWYRNTDTVAFKEGVTKNDIEFIKDGDHLKVVIKNTTDSLTIQNWFNNWPSGDVYRVEQFKFADGTALTSADIESAGYKVYGTPGNDNLQGSPQGFRDGMEYIKDVMYGYEGNDVLQSGYGDDALYGGSGDDSLHGGDGNDILDGGAGNDYMDGGSGDDTYKFGRGSGRDTIGESYDQWGYSTDTVEFKDGITKDDIEFRRVLDGGYGSLEIIIKDTNDSLKIEQWFGNWAGDAFKVEQFKFADGTVLNSSDIEAATGYNTNNPIWGNNDTLNGGDSNDTLYGGEGNDVLNGSGGNDTLYGGAIVGFDEIRNNW